jgi:hypothetical protein
MSERPIRIVEDAPARSLKPRENARLSPGTPIELGGVRWILPPMNVATLQFHAEFFKGVADGSLAGSSAFTALPVLADVIYRCLKRNYPDVTSEEIAEHVDLGNMDALFQAVVKTSGLTTDAGESLPADGRTGTTS